MTGTTGPLGLDPALLEILACPDTHHSPLEVDEAADELLCTTCDRAFPVRDGIPVLLLDEARRRGPEELGKRQGTAGA
ncbi:Trm112 family protein [Trujillonella humicola]|uniref:Trm112 family protein n=1 Tax=Trujillonella humicola TaxID=3383699 RepID=UPI0039061C9F